MEENKFKCSGDCLNCHPNQRQYCAAQFSYNSMRMIVNMQESLKAMQGSVDELKAKIEAIQNNETNVFNPSGENSEIPKLPIAQSGEGAENRSPETI